MRGAVSAAALYAMMPDCHSTMKQGTMHCRAGRVLEEGWVVQRRARPDGTWYKMFVAPKVRPPRGQKHFSVSDPLL